MSSIAAYFSPLGSHYDVELSGLHQSCGSPPGVSIIIDIANVSVGDYIVLNDHVATSSSPLERAWRNP